ncbi:FKBP-type peptidyl-prolyl cis-trans isomerase [Beggiatoa alba]|nr:FKBP-type peptidyl-prolyl cis-trans isomerase [Beggiatoa alba]
MKRQLILSGLAAILVIHTAAAIAAKPSTEKEKFSYAIGMQIGQGFKRDNLEIDTTAMSHAINDVLNDKTPQLSAAEIRETMEAAQKKLLATRADKGQEAKNKGQTFLAANKEKEGIITRDSGLQYKILLSGKGKQPKISDSITAHYRGTLINGTEFDSSYKRRTPATFNVGQVIQGWQEVLPLMHEGDKWQVFIPSELAYGERGSGNTIGPNEALIFEIELIKVN